LAALARFVRNREALRASAVMWRQLAREAARTDGATAEPNPRIAGPPT
jgi:hypothetical protein